MKCTIVLDTTPCSPLKVTRRFGVTCRRKNQARNQREAGSKQSTASRFQRTARCCIPEDRRQREVSLSTRRQHSIVTCHFQTKVRERPEKPSCQHNLCLHAVRHRWLGMWLASNYRIFLQVRYNSCHSSPSPQCSIGRWVKFLQLLDLSSIYLSVVSHVTVDCYDESHRPHLAVVFGSVCNVGISVYWRLRPIWLLISGGTRGPKG
jgi:hypothetical protein